MSVKYIVWFFLNLNECTGYLCSSFRQPLLERSTHDIVRSWNESDINIRCHAVLHLPLSGGFTRLSTSSVPFVVRTVTLPNLTTQRNYCSALLHTCECWQIMWCQQPLFSASWTTATVYLSTHLGNDHAVEHVICWVDLVWGTPGLREVKLSIQKSNLCEYWFSKYLLLKTFASNLC